MRILAIETSCDETSVSIVDIDDTHYTILAHSIWSQIHLHKEFGGVFPAVAQRAHAEHLPKMITQALFDAGYPIGTKTSGNSLDTSLMAPFLERYPETQAHLERDLAHTEIPDIDALAVTYGPGLEPALWVGISVAQALSVLWNIPLIPVNHMEGHIASAYIPNLEHGMRHKRMPCIYPACALLISGGHTEFVEMHAHNQFRVIGATRDDAVGEAFDKVARLIGLPYPGGPHIEKAAGQAGVLDDISFPRPMLHTQDFDMSFSGLKTAVRYFVQDIHGTITDTLKGSIARAFQDAVTDVLATKTKRVCETYHPQTFIVAGGVSANTHIKDALIQTIHAYNPKCTVIFPPKALATDNALMIACAAYDAYMRGDHTRINPITADGNLALG